MKEVFEKITTAQKENDILLKVNEYLFQSEVIFLFGLNDFNIFGITTTIS